jgi:hypothetical protein
VPETLLVAGARALASGWSQSPGWLLVPETLLMAGARALATGWCPGGAAIPVRNATGGVTAGPLNTCRPLRCTSTLRRLPGPAHNLVIARGVGQGVRPAKATMCLVLPFWLALLSRPSVGMRFHLSISRLPDLVNIFSVSAASGAIMALPWHQCPVHSQRSPGLLPALLVKKIKLV